MVIGEETQDPSGSLVRGESIGYDDGRFDEQGDGGPRLERQIMSIRQVNEQRKCRHPDGNHIVRDGFRQDILERPNILISSIRGYCSLWRGLDKICRDQTGEKEGGF